ncbi:hypothetical protein V6N11_040198 [Hibiscus sabdariffa]|uniref:Uncharacterized protein n=1 Tax=Hibiscus sabdariffa TaxID=183260 RepID=A0ABR2RH65_9ROSI
MSDENPNSDNPNGVNLTGNNPNGVPFGLHGGQPPDMLAPLGRVQVLERPASPTELVSQRAAKKGKSNLDHTEGMELESEAVEVLSAGVTDRAADPIVMEKTGGAAVNGVDKVSYAAMAAKPVSSNVSSGKSFNFTEEEVVVLDEDCLVDDSGAFPMIKFSDRVHDQIDKNMQNVIIVRLLVLNEGNGEGELPNEDDLEREATVAIRKDVERPHQRINAAGKGMVQDRGVRLNKSYLESNPS